MYSTARQQYIDILTELVKEETPTLYMEDYLYYYNKAINEYMKSRYELYEVTQQLSDDLRVWKKIHIVSDPSTMSININQIGSTTGFKYRHLLSCIIHSTLKRPDLRCITQGANIDTSYKATRMSSEIKAGLLGNAYLQPEYYRPYFEVSGDLIKINIGNINTKLVKIGTIEIEYLMQPTYVDLTEKQVDSDKDTSQVLEFPSDVAGEILKVALKLILERGSNPRLQSNIGVNQTITDMSTGFRGGK